MQSFIRSFLYLSNDCVGNTTCGSFATRELKLTAQYLHAILTAGELYGKLANIAE